METIWVLENVERKTSFYSRLQILLLITSVSLWRKYHPKHKLVFYCDKRSNEFLTQFDIFHLWDEVRPLSYTEKINREIFWSAPKTKIISETKIPLLVIDHDFLIFRNIDEILDEKVIYSYDEIASNWYPPVNDGFNKRLTTPIERVCDFAGNVSFFYLPNPEFSQKYGKQTLENHIEFTSMNDKRIGTNWMIFSEQLMMKQMLVRDNIPHKTLSKNIWDCTTANPTEKISEIGIWNKNETSRSYKHYGVEEKHLREKNEPYEKEMEFLYRCVNSTKQIDITELKEKLKVIKKK